MNQGGEISKIQFENELLWGRGGGDEIPSSLKAVATSIWLATHGLLANLSAQESFRLLKLEHKKKKFYLGEVVT